MSLVMQRLEEVDQRVLGALSFVDATTAAPLNLPLQVTMPGIRLQRNASGLLVMREATDQATALATHAGAFNRPPAAPAVGSQSFTAVVHEPSGQWLPRSLSVSLPREPAATAAAKAGAGSLFNPIVVPLYPSSAASVSANWSVLRVSVSHAASGDALGGALLIVEAGGRVLARGLTDWRGEALVAVPGVPVSTWGEAAVVVNQIAASLTAVFNPATGSRRTLAQLALNAAPQPLPAVDPEALEAQRNALPNTQAAVALAAGREQALSLQLALP